MSNIVEALNHVVAELRAAGVNADTDPRNLTLPGCLVGLDQIHRALARSATVVIRILAIAPDNGNPYPILDELLDKVAHLVETPANAASVTMPNHAPAPLPALELHTTIHVTKE